MIHQEGALRSYFPGSSITRKGEREITWVHTVTPTPLSETYKIKLHYKKEEGISVYVVEPKLTLAEGKKVLPHVYSTPEQKLCLYYPAGKEWHPGMYYVKTLIPWACEWLYHYEIWVGTGIWHGGGIDHGEGVDSEHEKKLNGCLKSMNRQCTF